MNKEQKNELLECKQAYQAPRVELFQLGSNLSFLVQGFSSNGELDLLEDGSEIGIDNDEYPIG